MACAFLPGDSAELRKVRGAFFTPPAIADFLVAWAMAGRSDGFVLDPTCGEGVFLRAAARRLAAAKADRVSACRQLHGVDLHDASLNQTAKLIGAEGYEGSFVRGDFFEQSTPAELDAELPWMDAVVGNPPFVRYHDHRGEVRRRAAAAALAQGVRLSGLASSWAALLVHACGFLKADGRVAMVLPAELLTVGYAEPVRRWLRSRFEAVHLVFFDELQFEEAEEQVVLLVARGSGGCEAFALHHVRDAEELQALHVFDGTAVAPHAEGKWTDMLLPTDRRNLFRRVVGEHCVGLGQYGQPELGTVTGANRFFALSEAARVQHGLHPRWLTAIVPPGTKHLQGTAFTRGRWEQLKLDGLRVWLLDPSLKTPTGALSRYIEHGESLGVDRAYKCSVRTPWWRPPTVSPPDLFFTYMSHRFPRLVRNEAAVSLVNSMHGITLREDAPTVARAALPLLAFNSVTMLGAELHGRSYGGGILKMEPREAAQLPVPNATALERAWGLLSAQRATLEELVRAGEWRVVVARVDDALLRQTLTMPPEDIGALRAAASQLRQRRTRQVD